MHYFDFIVKLNPPSLTPSPRKNYLQKAIGLILVFASVKIASTSVTRIHSNIETGRTWWNPWRRVKNSDIDIDRSNLNNVNKFIATSKLTEENEISEKLKP